MALLLARAGFASLIAASLTALPLAACVRHECTAIGCQNGLNVEFSRPVSETGAYTVTLDLDGEVVTCQTALPFAACVGDNACSSPDVLLGRSGCALPEDAHEILGVRILSAPKAVEIRIERDGTEIASARLTPSYVTSQPNGEGCEPICEQASASFALP